MAYMTLDEQVESHIKFLREQGLNVDELITDGKFIRCHPIQEKQTGRGEYSYKSHINPMNNGRIGIKTWVRGISGNELPHSTYGIDDKSLREQKQRYQSNIVAKNVNTSVSLENDKESSEKARIYFEIYSSKTGKSKYLDAKNVRAYGIRFRTSEEHGNTVVIPARDINGKIKTCLNITENGLKRWLSGRSQIGTFHMLTPIANGNIIGICEGYATAATCAEVLEGLPISIVCAFDSNNLDAVGKAINSKYPTAKIIFLADNDRHLEAKGSENKGLEAARIASNNTTATSSYLAPFFVEFEPLKEFSDWNDLARMFGLQEVRRQILYWLQVEVHWIEG